MYKIKNKSAFLNRTDLQNDYQKKLYYIEITTKFNPLLNETKYHALFASYSWDVAVGSHYR